MKFMALFEKITRTPLKDCIINETQIIFIISNDNIAKAVGKNGSNVRLLEKKLGKISSSFILGLNKSILIPL